MISIENILSLSKQLNIEVSEEEAKTALFNATVTAMVIKDSRSNGKGSNSNDKPAEYKMLVCRSVEITDTNIAGWKQILKKDDIAIGNKFYFAVLNCGKLKNGAFTHFSDSAKAHNGTYIGYDERFKECGVCKSWYFTNEQDRNDFYNERKQSWEEYKKANATEQPSAADVTVNFSNCKAN